MNLFGSFVQSLQTYSYGVKGLEPSGEIVGCDEVAEMRFDLVMAIVMVALTVASLIVRFMRST